MRGGEAPLLPWKSSSATGKPAYCQNPQNRFYLGPALLPAHVAWGLRSAFGVSFPAEMSHGGEKRCPPRRLGCLWLGCSVEALRGLGVLTKTPTPCPGCWPSFLPTCQLAGESLWGRGADLELPRALPSAKPGGSRLLEEPGGARSSPT